MSKPKAKSRTKQKGIPPIPWDLILADYLADHTTTYSGLAKKFGVSKSSVGKKAKKDEWVRLRLDSTQQLVTATLENKQAQVADANKRHLAGAQMIQEAVLEGIRRIKDNDVEETIYFRDMETDDKGKKRRVEAGRRYINGVVYNSKTINELIRSYRLAADLERNVLGLANNINKFGDEDGEEQPIIFDIMGGATSGKRNIDTNDEASPATS